MKEHLDRIEKAINRLNHNLQRQNLPPEHTLWDEQDIAHYFNYSLDYTKKHIIKHPLFPPPRKLPTSVHNDRFSDRWKASDIINYAMKYDKSQ